MNNDSTVARASARPVPDTRPIAWSVIEHRDGTRTLTYGGQAAGYYSRIHYKHARGKAAGWRGVTHGGALLYAPTERRIRERLQEAFKA